MQGANIIADTHGLGKLKKRNLPQWTMTIWRKNDAAMINVIMESLIFYKNVVVENFKSLTIFFSSGVFIFKSFKKWYFRQFVLSLKDLFCEKKKLNKKDTFKTIA